MFGVIGFCIFLRETKIPILCLIGSHYVEELLAERTKTILV